MINHTQRFFFIGLYHWHFSDYHFSTTLDFRKIWNTTLFASSLLLNSPWNLTEDWICCHVCLPWSDGGHFPFSVPVASTSWGESKPTFTSLGGPTLQVKVNGQLTSSLTQQQIGWHCGRRVPCVWRWRGPWPAPAPSAARGSQAPKAREAGKVLTFEAKEADERLGFKAGGSCELDLLDLLGLRSSMDFYGVLFMFAAKKKKLQPSWLGAGVMSKISGRWETSGWSLCGKAVSQAMGREARLALERCPGGAQWTEIVEMFLDRTCPRSEDSEGFKVHFLQEHTTCFLSQLAQLMDLFFCLSQAADIGIFLLFTTHFALLTSSKCGWTFAFSPFLHWTLSGLNNRTLGAACHRITCDHHSSKCSCGWDGSFWQSK